MKKILKPEKPRKVRKPISWKTVLLIVIGLLLAAGIFFSVRMFAHKNGIYKEGLAFMEAGRYDEAVAVFDSLGTFRKSKELKLESAQLKVYRRAERLLAEEEYEAAGALFEKLGDFRDSTELFRQMGQMKKAQELYNQRDYDAAEGLLADLTVYSHAKLLLSRLQTVKAFRALSAELEAQYAEEAEAARVKDRQAALLAFDAQLFADEPDDLVELWQWIAYYDGRISFTDGNFWSAYTFFRQAKIADSEEWMARCPQTEPAFGVLAENAEYVSKNFRDQAQFTVTVPAGCRMYFCLTAEDGTKVAECYLAAGTAVTLCLKPGSYHLVCGWGEGDWYGLPQLFGSEAPFAESDLTMENGRAYSVE